jgi:uncharacterized protein
MSEAVNAPLPTSALVSVGPVPASIPPDDRVLAIDILRALALFGILMVNLLTEFRTSIFQQFLPSDSLGSKTDRFLDTFVSYAFDMKAFALFSLLFGVGMAIQYDQLASQELPFKWMRRRLLILLAFGLFHLLFIWNGDILTEYAVAGLLILPLIREDQATLALCSLGLFAFYVAEPAFRLPIYWPDTETFARHVMAANHAYAEGGFVEIWSFSLSELNMILPLHEFIFARTLALFLFGAWVWRSGLIRGWRTHRRDLLIGGALATAAGVALTVAVDKEVFASMPVLRGSLSYLAPSVQALGYAALTIVAISAPYLGAFLKLFAPMGRMSLTNYITQSIIFSCIFYGYGLGQFGRMHVTPAFVIGVSVYIVQLVGSDLWLRWFRFGPLEWLWRSFMYGRPQAMRTSRLRSGKVLG